VGVCVASVVRVKECVASINPPSSGLVSSAPPNRYCLYRCRCCFGGLPCQSLELPRALSGVRPEKFWCLETLQERDSSSRSRTHSRLHPAPTSLLQLSLPKLGYLQLTDYWQLTEELVGLMVQNTPKLEMIVVRTRQSTDPRVLCLSHSGVDSPVVACFVP
jgi:hypothetical protein